MVDPVEWRRSLLTIENVVVRNESVFDVVGKPMVFGACSLLCCTVFFILAVHYEWTNDLAPRCANRPKAVIKNAILATIPEKYRTNSFATLTFVYPVAWILWSYKLTYKQLIDGIPGTGTRKDGWKGPLLKTNVDAVILLKYHTLLFKISVLVAFLCMCVIIPINTTASCDEKTFGPGTCMALENNTDFIKTTIANIPNKFVSSTAHQLWVVPILVARLPCVCLKTLSLYLCLSLSPSSSRHCADAIATANEQKPISSITLPIRY